MRWLWRGLGLLFAGLVAFGVAGEVGLHLADGGDDGGDGAGRSGPSAVAAEPEMPAPQQVAVRPTGSSGELKVTWSAPVGAATDVAGYRVTAPGADPIEVAAGTTTATLRGLPDGEAQPVVVEALGDDDDETAASPVPGTPRTVGSGGCSGATITWDGGAATTAWSDAANWDTDVVPGTTDHVCIPDVDDVVQTSSRVTIASVSSAGTLILTNGFQVTDAATPSLLSATEWRVADIWGTYVVLEGSTLRATTASVRSLVAHLVVDGTFRVEAGTTYIGCGSSIPSGVDVSGSVELAGDVGLEPNGSSCTSAVMVRSTGALRKVSGTGASTIRTAVINEGVVAAQSGTLRLRGGSVATQWSGSLDPSGATIDGVATGRYEGTAPGVVELGGDGTTTITPKTYHVATPGSFAGAVTLASGATVRGSGSVAATGVLTVGGGSTLDAPLSGGTIRLGGTLTADVLPGVDREWIGGLLQDGVEVTAGTTVRVTGQTWIGTELVNRGALVVEGGGRLDVSCVPGRPSGIDNYEKIALYADGTGIDAPGVASCTRMVRNRAGAELRKSAGTGTSKVMAAVVNQGLVLAKTGELSLEAGSDHVDWTGATGTGAATGEYRGEDSGTVRFSGPAFVRATHTLGTAAVLKGTVVVGNRADLAGTVATVAASGHVTIDGGVLRVSLAGGHVTMANGRWAAPVRNGLSRIWQGGSVDGPIEVISPATVRVTGPVFATEAIVNRGTVRVEPGGQLPVTCALGEPSGFDNYGVIDLATDGSLVPGTNGGCTATVWNRSTGEIKKSGGAGSAELTVAVVNQGLVRSQSGRLVLRTGSAYVDWSGTEGSSSGPGAANGLYQGEGAGTVVFAGPAGAGTTVAVHTWASTVGLDGNLEIAGRAQVTGSTALLAATGTLTVRGGTLDVEVQGGLVHIDDDGHLTADVLPGVDRTWESGSATEPFEVRTGAVLRVTGDMTLATSLLNRGTISLATGADLEMSCVPGRPSGLDNHGSIELAGNGNTIDGYGGACTSTIWNRAEGKVLKTAGTGASDISVGVVNEGLVRAESGRLVLRVGSAYDDWTGTVGSGSGDGAATGRYDGQGSGVVVFASPTITWGQPLAAHVWAPSATFFGNLEVTEDAMVAGSTVTMDGSAILTLADGTLDVAVGGGTVRMTGGMLSGDVLPGVDRQLSGGSLVDGVEVASGATVRLTGQVWGHTAIVNRGTIRFETGGRLLVDCVPGRPSGLDSYGLIDLAVDGTGLSYSGSIGCTPVVWNRSTGEIRKSAGSGSSDVGIAVVNNGKVIAKTGRLTLRIGSAYVDWTGVAGSGSGDGAAGGEYRGDAPGVVVFDGIGSTPSVHRVATGVTLRGNLEIAGKGDLVGTSATLGQTGILRMTGGSLDVLLSGGRIRMSGGWWKADVAPGIERTWSGGSAMDQVQVRTNAVVDVTDEVQIHTNVRIVGSVRIAAFGQLIVDCSPSAPSGVTNDGTIEILGDGTPVTAFSNQDCKGTIWNRDGGIIRKSGGAGEANMWVALVNDQGGLVTSTSGRLLLRDGSAPVGWAGTSAPAADGAARGTFNGDGGTVVFAGGGGWGGDPKTYTWSPQVILRGRIELADDATVVGTGTQTATLATGGRIDIEGGALHVAVAGGKIKMTSGTWAADIRAGQTEFDPEDPAAMIDRSRVVEGGQLRTLTVEAGATLVIEDDVSMPDHSTLTNEGVIKLLGSARYPICDTCTLVNHEYLDLIRDIEGVSLDQLQAQTVTVTGTFTNHGIVRQIGTFPGVRIEWDPFATVTDWGRGELHIDMPEDLLGVQNSAFASDVASMISQVDTLGGLIREIASYTFDNGIVGTCVNGTVEVVASLVGTASVCAITDGGGTDAITVTFGGGVGFKPGLSVIPGFSAGVDAGVIVGRGFGTTMNVESMGGLFICASGSGSALGAGLTGSFCYGQENEDTYDLEPGSIDGQIRTLYGGVSLGGDIAEGGVSSTLTYTLVMGCDDVLDLTGKNCPSPPKITGLSRTSGYSGDGTLTIYGESLSDVEKVEFVQFVGGDTNECAATVLEDSRYEVVVAVPSCGLLGDVAVVVTTEVGGSSEEMTTPADRVFKFLVGPPPP